MNEIRIGIVGAGFMGGAHSRAYIDVGHLFNLPARPLLQAACTITSTRNIQSILRKVVFMFPPQGTSIKLWPSLAWTRAILSNVPCKVETTVNPNPFQSHTLIARPGAERASEYLPSIVTNS